MTQIQLIFTDNFIYKTHQSSSFYFGVICVLYY